MSGEAEQRKGRQGAMLAKRWLERTTRVNRSLLNPDGMAAKKLTLQKAKYDNVNSVFSFDLGGSFRGGDLDGQDFMAECKKYATASDLPKHFRAFLAHCYRAIAIDHHMADQLLWISFAPHGGDKWDKLSGTEAVKQAVLHKDLVDVNFKEGEDPDELFSDDIAAEVSKRVSILILSEWQIENLIMSQEHHGVIEKYIVENAKEVM
ncbi:hypothetical protein [Rhodococcoides fascians]|uniref:hypothetical protein n=1 Tax=Rhodococcoides fascians TaxID=1828 RepID=UPI00050CCEA4|nr:hypothetical protein [Rhodococcus fascians]